MAIKNILEIPTVIKLFDGKMDLKYVGKKNGNRVYECERAGIKGGFEFTPGLSSIHVYYRGCMRIKLMGIENQRDLDYMMRMGASVLESNYRLDGLGKW